MSAQINVLEVLKDVVREVLVSKTLENVDFVEKEGLSWVEWDVWGVLGTVKYTDDSVGEFDGEFVDEDVVLPKPEGKISCLATWDAIGNCPRLGITGYELNGDVYDMERIVRCFGGVESSTGSFFEGKYTISIEENPSNPSRSCVTIHACDTLAWLGLFGADDIDWTKKPTWIRWLSLFAPAVNIHLDLARVSHYLG